MRVLAHTIVGGLTGGLAGAAGAATGTLTAPNVAAALSKAGVDPDLARELTGLSSTLAGAAVGGTAGGSAAYNEVTNNYLRHVESERLTALSKKKELGQCDADCEREMSDLRALDIARDRALANCVGVSSAACEQTRQLVRTAAAEYIRNEEILNTRGSYYGLQSAHTTSLAYETIDGKAAGVWQSVKDMFVGVYDVLALGYNAKNGDIQAINQLVASSRAVSEFLSDASNLPYLVGFMSPAQRETFATAVESNDGKTVGKMLTDQTVAFIGTLSIAADAAKLATLSGTALKDAVVSATNQKSVGGAPALANAGKTTTGTTIQTYWPPNGGFLGTPVPQTLGAGYQFSRYGGFFNDAGTFQDFGSFVAPAHVPYGMRALPPGSNLRPLTTYEVVRPIPGVPSGRAAPAFGEIGLGTQHQLPLTIQDYLDQGYIKIINQTVPAKP
jgi:hypothetical protein